MKVLITDTLSDAGKEILKAAGHEVLDGTGLSGQELLDAVADSHALIVRSGTQVTAEVIEAGRELTVIGRAGVGVDNIDLDAATRQGVVVMNTPEGNTISAAELTMAMILALSRHIPQAQMSLVQGKWDRKAFRGTELRGKTLGIIGVGRIGRAVARRAAAFGMKVVGYDPFIASAASQTLDIEMTEFDELIRTADYISVHTPLTDETRGMLGADEIAKMKDGVRLVNCARGGIVDEAALVEGLTSGKVAGCALDVYAAEPPTESPLLGLENVVCTPHLGALTREAQQSVAEQVATQVCEVLDGKPARNAVNAPMIEPETLANVQPYAELAARLGKAVVQLWDKPIEEIRVTYAGEFAENPLEFVTASLLTGILSMLMEGPVNQVNAPIIARERGVRVSEVTTPQSKDFSNLLTVEVGDGPEALSISGAFFGINDPRIVRINAYHVDVVPDGYIIVCSNKDKPGVISYVSTILAEHEVNIANMTVGRDVRGGTAVTVINVDDALSDDVLAAIKSSPIIFDAKLIRL
ncbi:MAG: phosphoglycerate dehydrogenase [Planctomycetota bacterium]